MVVGNDELLATETGSDELLATELEVTSCW